ncbi:MAG: NADP-dependent isocitrate dehydrogenase, partial [Campylobacter sp.]|nr:NADP-dependent isocitrate dehydrogenase [Campylobacter sp.]
ELKANEEKIMNELLGVQGKSADMGGYYMFDENKANAVMRPSATLNKIIG